MCVSEYEGMGGVRGVCVCVCAYVVKSRGYQANLVDDKLLAYSQCQQHHKAQRSSRPHCRHTDPRDSRKTPYETRIDTVLVCMFAACVRLL